MKYIYQCFIFRFDIGANVSKLNISVQSGVLIFTGFRIVLVTSDFVQNRFSDYTCFRYYILQCTIVVLVYIIRGQYLHVSPMMIADPTARYA